MDSIPASEGMHYEGDCIRPPPEASSILLQVTLGCSHNKCTFCGTFKNKRFQIKSDDIILANRLALSRLHGCVDESCLHGETDVSGSVVIAPTAHIENSVIRGPAIIGENTRIVDSYVGPFTSIYHDVLIRNSEIENSVVLEHCEILDVSRRIESSLIGRHAYVANSRKKPKALRLVIADYSNIQL